MSDPFGYFEPPDDKSPANYARARLPRRIYINKTFPLAYQSSRDFGHPARFINIVFDQLPQADGDYDLDEFTVTKSARIQITLMIAREQGVVRQLRIEKAKFERGEWKLARLLELDRDQAARLINAIRLIEHIPIQGNEERVVVDDDLLQAVLQDPLGVRALYSRDKDLLRDLVANDSSAEDLIAFAHRREELENFRMLLEESDKFDAEASRLGGPEKVWQQYLDRNPWILGVSLSGQLLAPWSDTKLEQVVVGNSIEGGGKRADALLRTTGLIRSMVFAEIKHHRTKLLRDQEYRTDCWAPSHDLAGGVTQAQQTVYRAVQKLTEKIRDTADDGSELDTETYLVRPRSYLIIGHMGELLGASGGVHPAKHRSFELYRRNLYEPEVLTFDELLARAEWHLSLAEDAT